MTHEFDVKTIEDDNSNAAILNIPEQFKKGLRGHKIICTLIGKSSGIFGSKVNQLHSTEIGLAGLTASYEMTKQISYERVKFDVIVRVRQAYGGKEMEVK